MTTDQTYKPSEGKREEFRKYLEKNGVLDALTKVLVNLYEEVDKPADALEYIRDKLAMQVDLETHKQLVTKLDDATARIKALEEEIEKMKIKTEPDSGGAEPEEAPAELPSAEPAKEEPAPAASPAEQ